MSAVASLPGVVHGPAIINRRDASSTSDREHLKIEDSSGGLLHRRLDVLADTKEIDMHQVLRSNNSRSRPVGEQRSAQNARAALEDSDLECIDREEETKESLPIDSRITTESLPTFYNNNESRLNKTMLIASSLRSATHADETSMSETNVRSDSD